MKLSLKLPLAFCGACLLVLAAALGGIHTLHRAVDTYAEEVAARQREAQSALLLLAHFKTQVQEWKNVLLRGKDAPALERHWTAFKKSEREITEQAAKLAQQVPAGETRALVERFAQAHAQMGQRYTGALQSFKDAGFDARVGDKAVSGMDRESARLLEELGAKLGAAAAAQATEAEQQAERATWASLVAMGLATVAGVGGGLWLSRGITRRLGGEPEAASALVQAIAEGDLTRRVALRAGDEASLMAAMQRMSDQLAQVVSGVRRNAESVATASQQIAQGNADLSQRTDEQAASLQQAASSMHQLGSAAGHNTRNAQHADELAREAATVARLGGEVVGQVVETMKGISDSSRRIADIIGTIDGIAFQTNILALNAAVEAARAGEQGRGFAVVAAEVRTLAGRSAEAAREIRQLIGASVERVEQGAAQVDRAGQTMQEVVGAIGRVSAVVAEISTASAEQTSGVQQVGEAVGQMDRMTQQNAALVEESAAAAESLQGQAAALVRSVSRFRIDAAPVAA